ncbi:MAG: HupE/UreJ family protein [Chthoniobacterales bacterium]
MQMYKMELRISGQILEMSVRVPVTDIYQSEGGSESGQEKLKSELLAEMFPALELSMDGKALSWEGGDPKWGEGEENFWITYHGKFALGEGHFRAAVIPPDEYVSYLVVRYLEDGTESISPLSKEEPYEVNFPIQKTQGADHANSLATVFGEYVEHGLWHILSGYDHMLFMAALVLAATSLWDLVKVVTAFTLAHTITLTLAVLQIVHLNPAVVEPIISASIVFVAVQNMIAPERSRGWGRLAVAFCFGLFHGLGFAGGLLEAMSGLGAGTVFMAIIAFSLGVEIGHQFVVIPLYSARVLLRKLSGKKSELFSRAVTFWGSAWIALAGMVYFIKSL